MFWSRRDVLAGLGAVAGAVLGAGVRRARGESTGELLRPPGAPDERAFLAACIRCGQCVEVCPDNALRLTGLASGAAVGTPFFDARLSPCTLCSGRESMRCIDVCPTAALRPLGSTRDVRIGTAVINESTCLAYNGTVCRACWHACPFPDQAIRLDAPSRVGPDSTPGRGRGRRRRAGRGRPVINSDACVGCGLCTRACLTEPTSIPIVARGSPAWRAELSRSGTDGNEE